MSDSSQRIAGLSAAKLALLSRRLGAGKGGAVAAAAHIARRGWTEGAAPLSFAQQRLWFIEQYEPGNPAYNIPLALRLRGRLSVPTLERTLNEIVRRHETLRTTFGEQAGQPEQLIAPAWPVSLPVADLSGMPEAEREREAEWLMSQEVGHRFNLSRGPLWRVKLVRLCDDEHLIGLTMHHIISDGWSMDVVVREFAALYTAFADGRPSPLGELPIQYADYAVWQREWLQGAALKEQTDYWRGHLAGAPPTLELPTDRPRSGSRSNRGATEYFSIPAEVGEKLRAVAQAHEATTFMVLLAAYSVLLTRYSGQTEVSVGAPIANRRRAELEGLIGFFVNTLVLRVKIEAGEGFGSLVERVREVCLGAYAHQDVPFEKLVEELQPERSLSHAPLFQVALVLQNVPRSSLDLQGLSLSQYQLKYETAKFELSLVLGEGEGGITGALMYLTDLFDASTAARMVKNFQTLLRDITENPDKKIEDLSMFDDEGSRELIRAFNDELE